jgi:hypothetical protein
MRQKLRAALVFMKALIATGKDFADAHERAVAKYNLSDADSRRLIELYDNE